MGENIFEKAGLIDRTSRSVYVITDLGEEAVKNGSSNVDLEYLRRFDSFNEFSNPKNTQSDNCVDINKKKKVRRNSLSFQYAKSIRRFVTV